MLVIGRRPVFGGRVVEGAAEARAMIARPGHAIWIGPDILVRVLDVSGGVVHIGIEAPRSVPIRRDELEALP